MFLYEEPNRQSLYVPFDILESDMPFRNAFPIFLRNAITFLHHEQDALLREQHQIGELMVPLRPMEKHSGEIAITRLDQPDSEPQMIPFEGGTFAVPTPNEPASLRFQFPNREVYTAVNLASREETRMAPVAALTVPEDALELGARLFGTLPWIALAAASLLLVALEWLTYQMRWTE